MNTPQQIIPDCLLPDCERISRAVAAAGGRAFLVGGAVRDGLLGIPVKDADIEVFGVPADALRTVLRRDYFVVEVGEQPIVRMRRYE